MSDIDLQLTVNGHPVDIKVGARQTLLSVLRDNLGIKSVKEGCGQGDCGACVVILNGRAINSCLVLSPQAQNSTVITVEFLESNGKLHPLQRAFAEKWGFQCGFCTPGMLMSAYALLLNNPNPTQDEIRIALSGNLCRCTGYIPIIDSVQYAAELMRMEHGHPNG